MKYYQPNEVVFREGIHTHTGDSDISTGSENTNFPLEEFFSTSGSCPDKNEHALYYIDTEVVNSGDGKSISAETNAKKQPIVVLFKGDKPVSVDYRYVANAPKISIDDYGLKFDNLFSLYRRL